MFKIMKKLTPFHSFQIGFGFIKYLAEYNLINENGSKTQNAKILNSMVATFLHNTEIGRASCRERV